MKILEIFEKVNLVTPLEQRKFFNYLENTVIELQSLYDGFVFEGEKYTIPEKVTDEVNILPLYKDAIADNILFLAGAGETYKSEFLRKSNEAYLKYWNDKAKGRRVKRMKW